MYQTIIIKHNIKQAIALLKKNLYLLTDSGNIFICVRNEYASNGDVTMDFMDVITAGEHLHLSYINTIVVPTSPIHTPFLIDNVLYIIWLVKDTKNYFFDKDRIREKHIWKNVEWGHRAKNYNPKGKDPGNVWIPTLDDGKGHITQHLLLSFDEVCSRLVAATTSSDKQALYLISETQHVSHFQHLENHLTEEKTSALSAPKAKIYFSSSENMFNIPDNSIDMVVTSPPYWDLKDYKKAGQIGQETFPIYLQRINQVWTECYNKLHSEGSLWININIRKKNSQTFLLPKNIIVQCKEIGFSFKGILIWHKSSGIPTTSKNLVDHHEYVLLFTKSPRIYSFFRQKYALFCDYKNEQISGKSFWNINRKAGSVGKKYIHPAIFPIELVNRTLQLASKEGAVIMDPFLGSGTSLIAALNNNRSAIGYEFNEQFYPLIKFRIDKELVKKCQVDFVYIDKNLSNQ